jgi:hypothetical protein
LSVGRDKVPQLEQAAAPPPLAPAVSSGYAAAPVLDGIDSPGARVYEMGDEEFSTVMVIDESYENLDV